MVGEVAAAAGAADQELAGAGDLQVLVMRLQVARPSAEVGRDGERQRTQAQQVGVEVEQGVDEPAVLFLGAPRRDRPAGKGVGRAARGGLPGAGQAVAEVVPFGLKPQPVAEAVARPGDAGEARPLVLQEIDAGADADIHPVDGLRPDGGGRRQQRGGQQGCREQGRAKRHVPFL